MKKFLSLLMVICLLAGMLSGCGGVDTVSDVSSVSTVAEDSEVVAEQEASESIPSDTPTEAAATDTTEESAVEVVEPEPQLEAVELPLFDETQEYSMWAMLPSFLSSMVSDMSTDINTLKLLQENCNVKLNITSVSADNKADKFNILVASGDYTDIISDGVSGYAKGYDGAISDGIIIDLYDLAEEYAPNYMYYLNTDTNLRASLVTDNGYLPTLATIYKEAGSQNSGIMIRGDWLSELGLAVPETYNQLHDYVQACIDTYGCQGICIGSVWNDNRGDDLLYSYGFDLYAGEYNVIDGEVVYSYLNDNYYDYLSLIAEWYADGTIYGDFYSTKIGETDQWFALGQSCLNAGTASNIAAIDSYKEAGQEMEILPLTAPKVNADDELHFSWTDTFSRIKQQDSWAISTACDDPEGVLQIANYLFSEEGQLMYNYGDEGNTFEYDIDGNPQFSELVTNNPDGLSFIVASYIYTSSVASGHMPSVYDAKASYYYFTDAEWAVYETFLSCDADGSYNLPNGVALNEEEAAEYASLASDVTTYAYTEILKFELGQTELTEETFENFRNNIRSLGGDRMEELYQQAYDRFIQK